MCSTPRPHRGPTRRRRPMTVPQDHAAFSAMVRRDNKRHAQTQQKRMQSPFGGLCQEAIRVTNALAPGHILRLKQALVTLNPGAALKVNCGSRGLMNDLCAAARSLGCESTSEAERNILYVRLPSLDA